jgi:hypothetical protein
LTLEIEGHGKMIGNDNRPEGCGPHLSPETLLGNY